MSECSNGVRPSFMGLVIQTSDVTLYDGLNLSCISGTTLNELINSIDEAICTAVAPSSYDASNISYSGTLIFGCFTMTGTNVETIIEELATELCAVDATLTALTLNSLTLGAGLTSTCLGNYLASANPITVLQDILDELCTTVTALDAIELFVIGSDATRIMSRDNDFVYSGGGKVPIGLAVTMAPGVYFVDGRNYSKGATGNVNLTATADNYIDYNALTDTYVVTPVAIAAPPPAIAASSIRLWMLTTNAFAVTVTTDLRVLEWVGTNIILNSAITTAKVADLAITGAKMESVVAAAVFGDSDIFTITYDVKGRITASTFNIDLTGLLANDVLQWDGAQWVPNAISSIGGAGTNGRMARFTAATTIADSLFRDNGTTQGLNAAVAANIQFNVATTLEYGQYLTNSGVNATQYGYYATVAGATSTDVGGYFEANGSVAGLAVVGSYVGLIGTSATLNAREAFGGRFAVNGDVASSGDCVALYAYANNDGSGAEIGLMIEKGQSIFGSSATPDDSALVQLDSTTQGLVLSRMTTVQRNAIASPINGLLIYNTTTAKLNVFTTAWEAVTSV